MTTRDAPDCSDAAGGGGSGQHVTRQAALAEDDCVTFRMGAVYSRDLARIERVARWLAFAAMPLSFVLLISWHPKPCLWLAWLGALAGVSSSGLSLAVCEIRLGLWDVAIRPSSIAQGARVITRADFRRLRVEGRGLLTYVVIEGARRPWWRPRRLTVRVHWYERPSELLAALQQWAAGP